MARRRSRLPAGLQQMTDGRYRIRVKRLDPVTKETVDVRQVLPHGTSIAEAVAALTAKRAEVEAGPQAQVPTLAAYSKLWIQRRSLRVRRKTAETYARRIGRGLLPCLGEIHIDELTRAHIVRWRDDLQAADIAPATALSRWRDGLIVLRDALAEYGLEDCTRRIDAPAWATAPRERHILLREEVEELLNQLSGRYVSFIRFLARTGVRLGEARGLRWCDLDLEEGVAHLRQSITSLRGGSAWQVAAPKSKRARIVGLTPDVLDALLAWRKEMPGVGEALVWRTTAGQPIQDCSVYRALDAATKRTSIKIRVRPQVLRSTFNSIGLAAGVDRLLLQSMIGHTGDGMTAHYHGLRASTAAKAARDVWSTKGASEVASASQPSPETPTTTGSPGASRAGS